MRRCSSSSGSKEKAQAMTSHSHFPNDASNPNTCVDVKKSGSQCKAAHSHMLFPLLPGANLQVARPRSRFSPRFRRLWAHLPAVAQPHQLSVPLPAGGGPHAAAEGHGASDRLKRRSAAFFRAARGRDEAAGAALDGSYLRILRPEKIRVSELFQTRKPGF